MKIVVHDFAGHPFQIQLSRSLAQRGHEVTHLYCGSLRTTPSGTMARRRDDPSSFEVRPITLSEAIDKYSFFKRWRQERSYGRLLRSAIQRIGPDVVLSGNTPLDAQRTLQRLCSRDGILFVFWLQDILSIATHRIIAKKYPGPGHLVGRYYLAMERRMLRASDAVVLITEDFRPLMAEWSVDEDRLAVIENWSPLDEVSPKTRSNSWSIEHGLEDKKCFIYTGTLGMKHNPDLLLRLARHFRSRDDVRIVVLSQGLGAEWLHEHKEAEGLSNLILMGFCPFDVLPDVLATAEVLVALLEPQAGVYSVPSKVLTYFCAGRPILLAVPEENLAARLVRDQGAGIVVPPGNPDKFVASAELLVSQPERREGMGKRARAYAEAAFDIERITNEFLTVLEAN